MRTKILFLLFCCVFNTAIAQDKTNDKTLSPYFFVKSDDKSVDQLPLLHTDAEVNIAGVISNVKVTQLYKNNGTKPLEAIYMFPASTRAAVYDMKMTIGKRIVQAKIEKKEKARADYEKAKAEGKTASLLEQETPNVFQMNVANILPGDTIKVELFYTELLVPEEGVYEFVYPTVVGPRYSNEPKNTEKPKANYAENPYLKEGEKPNYTFDIKTTIRAGIPIQNVASTSHKVDIKFGSKSEVVIKLNEKSFSGNKDYILQYRLKGDKIENGLILYEGENENFFLMMMQPPKRLETEAIPKREYIFILDVSGSMRGYPLTLSKKLMGDLVGDLRETDIFNVMLFAGTSGTLWEKSKPANQANLKDALSKIDALRGSGGTDLYPALQKALAITPNADYARTFAIVTDGFVTVRDEVFELIQDNLGEANFFTFGIGSSVNRDLIEGMARIGFGEPFIVTKQDEAAEKAEKFKQYIQSPVLTNIDVQFDGFEAYDVVPKAAPDLMANRPLIVFGKYKGDAKGKIAITGTSGNGKFSESLKVKTKQVATENIALRTLWARHKIQLLDDYALTYRYGGNSEKRIAETTELGLKYNLLTKYTSFIAIDKEVRTDGEIVTVKQPLPMPEGVSNSAIGGNAPVSYSAKTQSLGLIGSPAPNLESAEMTAPKPMPKPKPKPKPKRISKPKPDYNKIEEIFQVVEQMPRFPTCESLDGSNADKQKCAQDSMMTFIYKHLKYPEIAKNDLIQGTVVVSFVIEKDGRITDIKIVRDIGGGCGNAAKVVVEKMPNWIPGRQRNQAVRTQFNLPIRFTLR
jgi:Ca-activated chloride channel family protein